MEPWQYYMGELTRRAARVPLDAFGRRELIAEAAHDAYQQTTDHLTNEGWDEEHALTVTRLFGQAVKDWLANGSESWDTLNADMVRRYDEWINFREEV